MGSALASLERRSVRFRQYRRSRENGNRYRLQTRTFRDEARVIMVEVGSAHLPSESWAQNAMTKVPREI